MTFGAFASRDAFPARGGVGDDRPELPPPNQACVESTQAPGGPPPYVELHAHSAYSFLDGASLPEELAARAAELGYEALALTDHDGLYGSMEFAQAAKAFGIRPITGAEVTLEDDHHLTLLAMDREGYGNLCRLLSTAHLTSERKDPHLAYAELAQHTRGLIALSG